MLELYVGLIPGEEPIDRLVDGVAADPAVASAIDADLPEYLQYLPENLIVGDTGTGAILAIVPAGRRGAVDRHDADLGDPSGLWRRLRTRWTRAHGPVGASHV